MKSKLPPARFPDSFKQSTDPNAPDYRRLEGYFALHGGEPLAGRPVEVRLDGDDGPIWVYRGDAPTADEVGMREVDERELGEREVTPVYSLGGPGGMAVPTGRVFLRLNAGKEFSECAKMLRGAGFEAAECSASAAHAGWAVAESHSIADALRSIDRLATIPDLERAEPQMLRPAVRKGGLAPPAS